MCSGKQRQASLATDLMNVILMFQGASALMRSRVFPFERRNCCAAGLRVCVKLYLGRFVSVNATTTTKLAPILACQDGSTFTLTSLFNMRQSHSGLLLFELKKLQSVVIDIMWL